MALPVSQQTDRLLLPGDLLWRRSEEIGLEWKWREGRRKVGTTAPLLRLSVLPLVPVVSRVHRVCGF